jgi:hypothetical protein
MPAISWQEREQITYCLDDLSDAAEEQIATTRDIVDMIHEMRERLQGLMNR